MEIKKIGDNKIRCALTENEIRELGFDIDEIIGNGETTQQFMRTVLNIVEEQEKIDLEHLSPMVRAELMPDHSMAITFGAGLDFGMEELIDTFSSLLQQLAPERLEEFRQRNTPKEEKKKETTEKPQPMVCALRFRTLEDAVQMCKVCFQEDAPAGGLYKLEDSYYLVLDFDVLDKDKLRPFALGAMEYDEEHLSRESQIAFILEHGKEIVKNRAVETLMQL